MQKLKLYVISHTHWDREWYQTYQHFRYRLVRTLDDLLDVLDAVPGYGPFHLDGHVLPLEDYLEVRPENRARLERQIADGRILIGPWYVMPDEFLVSGEALVKNLQTGFAVCKSYGVKPFSNGYVVDIFGHNSQFPQILQGFGIGGATLYRGIADYEKDAFLWQAPDGSRVAVCKLDYERSYSNFYFAARWPFEGGAPDEDEAVRRMEQLLQHMRPFAATNAMVMMDGVDHMDAEPRLLQMLKLFNERIPDVEFVQANLEEYFAALDTAALGVVEGSLYNLGQKGVNNQLLKNVLSSMVHIKQQNDACERAMQHYAEPLNAFAQLLRAQLPPLGPDEYSLAPRRTYLDNAWRLLLQNHPHDSICGCSLSDVHRDNEYRYRQVGQMAEIATGDALAQLARGIRPQQPGQDNLLLYNPTQLAAQGPVLLDLCVADGEGTNYRWRDAAGRPLRVQVLDSQPRTQPRHGKRRLVTFGKMRMLRAAVELDLPAFGYDTLCFDRLPERWVDTEAKSYGFVDYHPPQRLTGSLMCGPVEADNGVLRVTAQPNGTLDVVVKATGHRFTGLLAFEDGGDTGDGWNYRKPVYDRVVYSGGQSRFEVLSDGPLACVWEIAHTLLLPAGLQGNVRPAASLEQTLTTRVTILKDSGRLEFETFFDNAVVEHRLRVLFPTDLATDTFYTKTPYDMTKWPVAPPNAQSTIEADTFVHPMQGALFLRGAAGSFSLYSRGLYEVEVADGPRRTVALTLLRSISSVPGTAQPEDALMKRSLHFEYAADFARTAPTDALLHAEQYRAGAMACPFTPCTGAGALKGRDAFVRVDARDKIISQVCENPLAPGGEEAELLVRLYDVSGTEETVTIETPLPIQSAKLANLKGDVLGEAPFEGNRAQVRCGAHKIVTLVLGFGQ